MRIPSNPTSPRLFADNAEDWFFFCLTIELYERMFGKIELPDGIKTENGGRHRDKANRTGVL